MATKKPSKGKSPAKSKAKKPKKAAAGKPEVIEVKIDAAFKRKQQAASTAMFEAVTAVFKQVLGEWDQDPPSTFAHLVGLLHQLGIATGATLGTISALLGNPMPAAMELQGAMAEGKNLNLIASFRNPASPHVDKKKRGKKEKLPDNVVRLPVFNRKGDQG